MTSITWKLTILNTKLSLVNHLGLDTNLEITSFMQVHHMKVGTIWNSRVVRRAERIDV